MQDCSINCYMSKTCDRKTGVCDGGCVEGWKPPLCNEGACNLFKTLTVCHCDSSNCIYYLSIQSLKCLSFLNFLQLIKKV